MTSHPEFNERNTGTEVAILATGVSLKGIGAATAFAFASQSPSLLILASRTRSKLEAVEAEIGKRFPDTGVELRATNGLYLDDCQISDPCEYAKDAVAAERPWKLSEEIVGEKFGLEG
ncbi:hypothetical protein QBC45DRAFT_397512 [Copromyces sp. CBS 386.78]|nr:hypothetical protein QBC45DRAFT_397512 [Copromyces sp. CBS 386.78]